MSLRLSWLIPGLAAQINKGRKRLGAATAGLLLLALLAAACSSASPAAPSATPVVVAEEISPSPTATVVEPTEAVSLPSPTLTLPAPTDTPLPPSPTQTSLPEPTLTPTVAADTPTPEPTSPTIGSTRFFEIDHMEQVYVPAGEFVMGTTDADAKLGLEGGRAYPEIPTSTVYLDAYWIDKYEVTNGQYATCVEAGVCKTPWAPWSYTRPEYYGEAEFENYPVMWVSWYMAKDYCTWAGRRLPTEAEWEKAARGTDGRRYPWGNDPVTGDKANFCDRDCPRTYAYWWEIDGYPDTSPVGNYPAGASPYGALDMAGNVWEWTGTLIRDYPYDPNDGREDLEADGERAWRGGPWSNGIWWMRASLRYRSVPTYWWFNLGIRCASSE